MNGNPRKRIAPKFFAHALQAILGFVCLLFLLFFIYHFLPSDPVETLLAKSSSGETSRELLKEQLGLTKPLSTQFWNFVSGILKLNLGTSLWTGQSVFHLIAERLSMTFRLALPALFCFISIGTLAGFLQALWTDQFAGKVLRLLISIFFCIPAFSLGAALARFNIPELSPLLILLIYAGATFPTLAALIHKRLLFEEQAPYSQAARAKGLSRFQLFKNHLLRPCIPLVISLLPWWWSMFLGTAIVAEPLLRINGLGFLAFEAFRNQDVPVLLGMSVLIGAGRITLGLVRDFVFDLFAMEVGS